mmetsp:Transcript_54909/g.102857  ORF Transcript_54909/g.102857 Transcript_54909/m.102857 type:complete len:98 (-) Transcript_54909:410-703(-)
MPGLWQDFHAAVDQFVGSVCDVMWKASLMTPDRTCLARCFASRLCQMFAFTWLSDGTNGHGEALTCLAAASDAKPEPTKDGLFRVVWLLAVVAMSKM